MEAVHTVEEYIGQFQPDIREILQEIRRTVLEAAPGAAEIISYGIPTYTLEGALVHFAAFKRHVGLYPGPGGTEAFSDRLTGYKQGRGSVQFPLDKPMPLKLIADIVRYRVRENLTRAEKKRMLRTCPNGHRYFKTSDCPVCPECEAARPGAGFLGLLSAPARRALENRGIEQPEQLAEFSEKEILLLHGIGKTSVPILKKVLAGKGLAFRQDQPRNL